MSTIFRIIDKYDVDDDEIDAIERLTDYDMNREEQENKLTFQQIRKLEKLEDLLYEALQTYIKKNTDYGDSFAKSYEEFGITAPIIRMSDKLERLKSLSKAEARVKDESIRDTLIDLANYAIMTVVELDMEDEKAKASKKEFEHVVNVRLSNAEKASGEMSRKIRQAFDSIDRNGTEDKGDSEELEESILMRCPKGELGKDGVADDYTEGGKLNI